MTKLEELERQRNEIDLEIKKEKEKIFNLKLQKEIDFKNSIPSEVRNWLIANTDHVCNTCKNEDDDCIINGFSKKNNGYDCPKCALIQWFKYDTNNNLIKDKHIKMMIDVHFTTMS